MINETLRDNRQRIRGYIETMADGRKIGRDAYKRIVGYYDPHSNITRGATMTIIGYGDELASLVLGS